MKPKKIILILALFMMSTYCQAAVKTGLDRVSEHKHLFEGRRLGIIANHTSYDSGGRFIVDVFRSMENVRVEVLYWKGEDKKNCTAGAVSHNMSQAVSSMPMIVAGKGEYYPGKVRVYVGTS